MKDEVTGEYITSENLKVHPRMRELYKFFKYNGKVVDIKDYKPENMDIFSSKVLSMIENCQEGWEELLPDGISEIIKDKHLFNYKALPEKVRD